MFGSLLVQPTLKLQHFSLFNFPEAANEPLSSYLCTVNGYKHHFYSSAPYLFVYFFYFVLLIYFIDLL